MIHSVAMSKGNAFPNALMASQVPIRRFRLGRRVGLSPGQSVPVVVEDRRIALFNVDGHLHAVDALCHHQGGPLVDGTMFGATVECPWHKWRYDVRSGARVDRIGEPIEVYGVDVDSEWIYLRLREDE